MARLTPQQAAAKWSQRLSGATQDIQTGVQNVTVSPAQKAIQAKAKLLQRFTESVNNGKWEAGLQKVTLQDWQQAIITKGIPRISQGAAAAQDKVAAFHSRLQPYQDGLKKQIDAMPSMTLADNVNRAVAWINGMAKMPKK